MRRLDLFDVAVGLMLLLIMVIALLALLIAATILAIGFVELILWVF